MLDDDLGEQPGLCIPAFGIILGRMIKRHSLMLGRVASILLLVYWAALATGTHVPAYVLGPASYNDKVAHFLGYCGLAFLMCFTWATHRLFRLRSALVIWGVVIIYGVVDELLQIPVPGRTGDVMDWVADASGALLGILVFSLVLAIVHRRILHGE